MIIETTIYVTSEKSNCEHEIKVTLDCSIQNDGIGAYEYWGAKGFDAGSNYLSLESSECYMVHNGNTRKINSNTAIDKEIERFLDNYEVEEDYPDYEPDYE